MRQKLGKLNHDFFILPIISGILLAFTLPPFEINIFSWIAFLPLFFFLIDTRLSNKKIFQAGLLTGIVYFGKVTYPLLSLNAWWWLQVQSVVYANRYLFLFWLLYTAVLIASTFLGVFALLFRWLFSRRVYAALILPFVWIAFEYVRSSLLFGFTWGNLGYALHNNIYLMQLAHNFGVYGISSIIILVNILVFFLAYEIVKNYKRTKDLKSVLRQIAFLPVSYVIITVFVGSYVYGLIEFQQITHALAAQSNSTLSFSILQPGNESESMTLDKFSQILAERPDVAILPESALPSLIFNEDSLASTSQVGTILPESKDMSILLALSLKYSTTTILAGIDSTKQQSDYSSIIVIEAGKVAGIYHKRTLMPFSERSVALPLLETTEPLQAGLSNEIWIKHRRVSALICSEILFPNLLKDASTSFIIAVGNDGVFNDTVVARQNNIIAQFDAVLARKYLVSAMKTGVSGIIDPVGRLVLQSSADKIPQILSETINLPPLP
ncbi:MAG: apolipoprotein N-acyltransferase [Minisyncoccota bacterium]